MHWPLPAYSDRYRQRHAREERLVVRSCAFGEIVHLYGVVATNSRESVIQEHLHQSCLRPTAIKMLKSSNIEAVNIIIALERARSGNVMSLSFSRV